MTKVYQCFAFKQNIGEECISFNSKEDFLCQKLRSMCIEESLQTAISFADERIFRTTEFLLPRAIPCFTILSFATEENVFVDCKSRVFNIRGEKGEAYRISIEPRSLQLIVSDRIPNGTSFRGRHSFKDEKRFLTLIHLEIKRHLI